MSVLGTLRDVVKASSQNPNRGGGEPESAGAFWCTDCSERIRDVDVEGETPPDCPECGDEMSFERSAASTGCAC
jgi:tRNA(Ile2) C34 agmatinyltransferase TiaS